MNNDVIVLIDIFIMIMAMELRAQMLLLEYIRMLVFLL